MDGSRSHQQLTGFTLVELMVVLTVLCVLLGIGLPAFQRLQESVKIQATVRHLMGDIILTRSEAIKRNRQVIMCPSSANDPAKRECAGSFANGWLIFEDDNRNRRLDAGESLIRMSEGIPADLSLTNRAATRDANELILFKPDGTSRRNRTLMVCSGRRPDIPSWSIVMNRIGRPRLARDWGACPIAMKG